MHAAQELPSAHEQDVLDALHVHVDVIESEQDGYKALAAAIFATGPKQPAKKGASVCTW